MSSIYTYFCFCYYVCSLHFLFFRRFVFFRLAGYVVDLCGLFVALPQMIADISYQVHLNGMVAGQRKCWFCSKLTTSLQRSLLIFTWGSFARQMFKNGKFIRGVFFVFFLENSVTIITYFLLFFLLTFSDYGQLIIYLT